MVEWLNGFFVPLIKIVFVGGIIGFIAYIVCKAFYNAYTKSFKFFLKYSIFRKPNPESVVKWCMECVEKGVGWYDAKKLLLIKNVEQGKVNEIMWIYDKILDKLGKEKGAIPYRGKNIEKAEVELPLW
jgi:hypothetical protein